MTDIKENIINDISTELSTFIESKKNKISKKEFSKFILETSNNLYDKYYKIDKEEKPKKPLSDYQLFLKEKMIELKEQNTGKNPKELMKEIGVMWKAKKAEN